MLESTLKSTPSYTKNNGSTWIVIVVCGGIILVIIVSLVITMLVGLYCYNIKRKHMSAKLNRGKIVMLASSLTQLFFY